VFAAEKDTFTPISCAQKMTNLLPFGELIVLADGSHAALIEQPEIINYTMNRFCKKHRLIKRSTYTKSPKE
jgi:pimeloyl-ACP methyl ester carboxylesterase